MLSGKRIERLERGAPGDFDWIENATTEQLEQFLQTGANPSSRCSDMVSSAGDCEEGGAILYRAPRNQWPFVELFFGSLPRR